MRYRETLTVPVVLERAAATPLHEQIAGQLVGAITRGSLAPGSRLPSTRTLATVLAVSRGVVAAGYDLLVAQGFAEGREGSGTYVAGRTMRRGRPRRGRAGESAARPRVTKADEVAVDFTPGAANAEIFPLAAWRSAWRQATCRVPSLGELPALGLPELRDAVAEHLLRTRGLVVSGHEVVITGGSVPGLRLVLDAIGGGTPVAVEEHAPPAWHAAVAGPNRGTAPLAVDGEGARRTGLPPDCRTLVLSTEGHLGQGRTLSAGRRVELAGWAHRTGGTLVEMACDAVFRQGASRLPKLLDLAPERTVLVGGFCAALAPTLRLGYLVVPRALAGTLRRIIAERAEQPPFVTQLAMSHLLADGTIVRLMHRRALLYRHKRGIVEEALRGVVGVEGLDAVGTVVLRLPGWADADRADADWVADALRARGIRLPSMGPGRLLLGYGHLGDAELRRGLRALVAVLRTGVAAETDAIAA